jgi:hypothetical protein
VSDAVPRLWLLPLFGHSMAWPPEAAASFTTTRGENVLWPERLSSSTTRLVPPLVLLEDELLEELEELLLDEELLELEELLDEDELDELLELDEELLLDDELELDDEELEVVPEPVQVGPVKLPSCVPWKPKTLEAVAPGAGSCQLQQLVN